MGGSSPFELSEASACGNSPFVFSESDEASTELITDTTSFSPAKTLFSDASPISMMRSPQLSQTFIFDPTETPVAVLPTTPKTITLSQIETIKQSSSEHLYPSILSPDFIIENNNTFIITPPDDVIPTLDICSPISSPALLQKLVTPENTLSKRDRDREATVIAKSLIKGIAFIKLEDEEEEFVVLFPERKAQRIEVGMYVTIDEPCRVESYDEQTYLIGCTRIDEINLG